MLPPSKNPYYGWGGGFVSLPPTFGTVFFGGWLLFGGVWWWHLVALTAALSLWQLFHPETTDIYDKKNMPRVVYCIHALRWVQNCSVSP